MSNAALNARSDAILNAPEELAIPESEASAVSWGAIIAGAVVYCRRCARAPGGARPASRSALRQRPRRMLVRQRPSGGPPIPNGRLERRMVWRCGLTGKVT
jgi:hypothetical protein